MDQNQSFEDDLKELGLAIQIREEKIKSLETEQMEFDKAIIELKVTLEKYRNGPIIEYVPNRVTEDETVQQILEHKQSAAGILYEAVTHHTFGCLQDFGVFGIVATLGKVDDGNISRLLSEYLGTETMLAVVCDTLKNAKAMESCDKEGSIMKNRGIHGLGAAIGRTVNGRFRVICLETLRPYDAEFIADDPQRRLDLPKPRLASGEIPRGFLGFAVNMLSIDRDYLFCVTPTGRGLRETLFYHLFSRVQVYKTEEDMHQALPCITDGALSLDGGLIRSTGVLYYGNVEEADVKFPKTSGTSPLPAEYYAIVDQIKETEWKKELVVEILQRERVLLDQAKFSFEAKEQELLQIAGQS